MDAIQFVSKKAALFLTFALLAVAPWQAHAAAVTLNPSVPSVTLFSGGSTQTVTVAASDGNSYNFTVSVAYASGDVNTPWLLIPASVASCPPNYGAVAYNTTTANALTLAVGCYAGSLSIGSHAATVTLTSTSPTAGYTGSFTVTYTQGGGGGFGTLTATPSSLTLCTSPGGTTYAYPALSTTSTGAITWNTPTSPAPWLTVGPTSGSVSSTGGQQLTVTASAVGYSSGTGLSTTIVISYNSTTLSIPVTFTVGSSCSSTPTGTLSLTQYAINWSYSTASPVTQFTSVGVNSSAASYGAYISSIGSVGWLSLYTSTSPTASTATSGTTGSTLYLETNANAQSLITNSYSATVTVNDSNGNIGYITVNLAVNGATTTGITVSPNPIALAAAAGQTVYAQTTVTVTSTIAGSVSASVSGTGLVSAIVNGATVAAGGSTTVTIYGYAANLAQNTYPGDLYITVTGSGQTIGPQPIAVNFQVGTTSTSGVGSAVAPATLYFNYETSQTAPLSQGIMIGGTSTFTVTTAMTNGTGWLSTNVASGTAPEQIFVNVNTTGLPSTTYTGTVTVKFGDGTVQTVTVNLNVVSATPLVYANPGTVIFNQPGTNPSIGVYLYTTDGSIIPVTVTTSPSWLTITSAAPTATQSSFEVQANTAGLANGLSTGSITVAYSNTTLTIPVVVYIVNSTVPGSGYLTFSANPLTFSAQAGSATTQSQSLTVSAATQTYFSASTSEQTCTGSTWLTISTTAAYSNQTPITVSANPTGLGAQTCSGTIQFSANGVLQTVGVSLTIGGGLTLSPATMAFSYNGSGTAPAAQNLTVTNTSAQTAPYTAAATVTTPSGGTWLAVSPASGSLASGLSGTLSVSVNLAGLANLAAGTYTGTVTVTPTGGTAQTVAVTLTVTGTVISAPTTPLAFSYQAGGTAPAAQGVAVTGGAFTATAAVTTPSGGTWLAVSPASGTAAATLSVSLVSSGLTSLTAGTYTGTITVTGTSGATGTVTINVTLTVAAPLPTITAVVNAASFISGPVSPGEVITIGGTALGPATALTLTVSNGQVATTLCVSGTTGCVSVAIGGTPAPLIYAASGQINAIVPYEVSGLISPTVVVTYQGQSSNAYPLQTVVAAPGILTQSNSGSGLGAILNQDNSVNGASHPAAKMSIVQVFMTGEGQTSPKGVTGKVNNVTSASQLPVPLLPVSATVGSVPALVTFAAEAPGFVSGVMQVNVQIPATVASGNNVPIVISVGTYATQANVTVSVQ